MKVRAIKSFVLRCGHMSVRQEQALAQAYPQYALSLTDKPLCFETIFARKSPTVVEIGFGMGDALLSLALQYPEINWIGIEVHKPGIGNLAANIQEHQLKNVRILASDAVGVFASHLAAQSLARIHIFFPDPWPKRRHHKRRLIQPAFSKLLLRALEPAGILHCATDWEAYALHMKKIFEEEPSFLPFEKNASLLSSLQRPLTKFEQKGLKLGHCIWDLMYIKTSE